MKKPRSCGVCRELLRPFGGLHLDQPRREPRTLLCIHCYLRTTGDSPDFPPISTLDCEGAEHRFEFQAHRFSERLTLEAREIRDGIPAGYRCSVAGDLETDPTALFQTLYQRLHQQLGRKYLTDSWRRHTVRGAIEWDSEEEVDVPRLVIDGRDVSWTEMGRMLMTYEGWSFKLEMFDRTDERP